MQSNAWYLGKVLPTGGAIDRVCCLFYRKRLWRRYVIRNARPRVSGGGTEAFEAQGAQGDSRGNREHLLV